MHRFALSLVAAGLLAMATPALADTHPIGDAERGAKIWKKCKACHQVGPKAKNRVGPNLNDIFDRTAGTLEDFRYSADMKRAGADGLVWSWDELDAFLKNPKSMIPRTRMKFRGLKNHDDRVDVMAYLRQFSASPQDIPEASPTAVASDPDVDPAILAINGDREYGEYLGSECVTCHRADGDPSGDADDGRPAVE